MSSDNKINEISIIWVGEVEFLFEDLYHRKEGNQGQNLVFNVLSFTTTHINYYINVMMVQEIIYPGTLKRSKLYFLPNKFSSVSNLFCYNFSKLY